MRLDSKHRHLSLAYALLALAVSSISAFPLIRELKTTSWPDSPFRLLHPSIAIIATLCLLAVLVSYLLSELLGEARILWLTVLASVFPVVGWPLGYVAFFTVMPAVQEAIPRGAPIIGQIVVTAGYSLLSLGPTILFTAAFMLSRRHVPRDFDHTV